MQKIVKQIHEQKLTEVDVIRCNHLWDVLETIHKDKVLGDLVETGVYKGGTSLIMAQANKFFKMGKTLWCCDSFEGCPDPKETKLGAHKEELHGKGDFSCPQDTVETNLRKFDLLDNNVKFVKGWFEDTMPSLPVNQIALLRFDGDLYSSTLDVLNNLYDKVSKGGFVIIDDYCLVACKDAVTEFLEERNLTITLNPPIGTTDSCGSWWRKE